MKKFDWLCGVLALSLVAACGDDDDGVSDNPDIDSAISLPVDAAPPIDAFQIPDAAPQIDARPPDLSCADEPEPTGELPAEITLNGTVQEVFLQGMTPGLRPSPDVAVEARNRASDEALETGTSDSLGEYGVVMTTGGNPVDAYLSLRKATYVDTYLFAPDALRVSGAVPDTVLLPSALLAFAPQLGINIQAGDGIAAVRVVDCEGVAIPGVEPTITGGGDDDTEVIDGSLFLPGTFLVINIPIEQGKGPLPTPVTIGATYNGTEMQANPIKVFADSVSFTEVHP